jgi:hypothetical protein
MRVCVCVQVGALATPLLMASLAAPFFTYISFGNIYTSRKTLMTALVIGACVRGSLDQTHRWGAHTHTMSMSTHASRGSRPGGSHGVTVVHDMSLCLCWCPPCAGTVQNVLSKATKYAFL